MLFLRKPAEAAVRSLLAARRSMTFSYSQVGATRTAPPKGWYVNQMCFVMGSGRQLFDKAVAALFSWQLMGLDGLRVFPSTAAPQAQTDVAILSRHFAVWSLDFCRVIYVLNGEREEGGAIERTGFGYGTLPGHAVKGEERFSIEWHVATEEVRYDIYSFSQPAERWVQLIAPIARATQRRFARASLEKAARIARPEMFT